MESTQDSEPSTRYNHLDLGSETFFLDFDKHQQSENNLFGGDFTLFDDVEFEKSLFDNTGTNPTLNSSSPFTSTPFDTSAAAGYHFTVSTLDENPSSPSIPILTTIAPHSVPVAITTKTTTPSPVQQIPTPSASGSEDTSSDCEVTSFREQSHGFTDISPALTSSPHLSTSSSHKTHSLSAFPSAPTQEILSKSFFPPLGPTSSSATPVDSSLYSSSVDTNCSKKRKVTAESTSPRPKELVDTSIQSDDDDRDVKRKRNTAAARRYRQKKQDRMKELEGYLEEMTKDRDRWKEEAHRQRMEAEKWHAMVEFMEKNMRK